MNKKLISFLLALIILVSCIPFQVASAADTPHYTVTDKTVEVGDVFTVDVAIADNPGIISLRFKVVYDVEALELQSVSNSGILNGFTTPAPTITSPYTLRWADSLATTDNTVQGTVATLTFKALQVTSATSVTIEHGEARNSTGKKITFANATANVVVKEKPVNVTGVTLNKNALTLKTGESETLKASVAPDNATNKTVTWKSSDPTVAAVDAAGKVVAVKRGNTVITVTTQDGQKTASCTVTVECGHQDKTKVPYKSPTCVESGNNSYYICPCGAVLKEDGVTKTTVAAETIAALGHDYESKKTNPTCAAQGYTTYTCARCGDSYTDSYTAPLGHDWDEGTVTKEPTETEAGERTYICSRCGENKTEAIPALGHTHSYTETVITPTCTEQGYTLHICSCGDSYKDRYTDALGHAWDGGTVTAPPTATETGVKTYSCTRCAEMRTEVIPATGGEEQKPCDGGANCPSAHFTDIHATDWYHEAVDFAVENGLFGGMSENTFEPNTAMTRAMLVTVLWRYAGEPAEGENAFTDVPDGQWYTDAVAWAAENNIVGGVGDNKFDPNGNITREQMATILYRYAGGKDIDTSARADLSSFPDAGNVSGYALDAMKWAVAEGLVNGSDGKLLPQGNATRAQVATILMRFIENIAE